MRERRARMRCRIRINSSSTAAAAAAAAAGPLQPLARAPRELRMLSLRLRMIYLFLRMLILYMQTASSTSGTRSTPRNRPSPAIRQHTSAYVSRREHT